MRRALPPAVADLVLVSLKNVTLMTPDELAKLKEAMNAALDFALSDANPFSRVAERVKEGMNWSDALSQELYPQDQRVEARAWLDEGTLAKQRRFLHTYSPRRTAKLIEELYTAGAKTVWVIGPNGDDRAQTAETLLVLLPRRRQQKLELARIHDREMGKAWAATADAGILPAGGKHLVFQYT